jgi:soluble P-type ATPase
MFEVDIPGRGNLRLAHLVSDYNGTIAVDGKLIPELVPLIMSIAAMVEIHVVTADTFGLAQENLQVLPVKLTILPQDGQDQKKLSYVHELGPGQTIAIGNGRNDKLMVRDAALGIAIVEAEGACVETFQVADIICRSPVDALRLLLNPNRLIATLRA